MQAKTIKGNSAVEISKALQESIADGYKPTLGFVFLSKTQDHAAVSNLLNDAGIAIFGATSNGEFTDTHASMGAIAILLLDINESYFSLIAAELPTNDFRDKTTDIAKQVLKRFNNPAFLISCSDTKTDAEELLRGFEDVVGAQVNVFGGAAGDDFTFSDQTVFSNNFESKRGLLVLALNEDKIKLTGRATCGWNPVGTVRTVTKSDGNHVYTVDDIPVLDLTAKYGGIQNVTPDNSNLFMDIACNFPLQLQREKGDPVMRPGLMIDWSDRSYFCSGTVPQGSKVRFSLPPDFDVVDKVINAALEMKATEMPEADAVIVFSCAGRKVALGPMIQQELEGVKSVWNAPMAGMFSNAELGRATGGNLEMHNLTTCCVALKEK